MPYKDPEQHRAYQRTYRQKRPEQTRDWQLRSKYGISAEEYDEMLLEQGGVCVICSAEPGKRRLSVDHCHSEGHVRGLLCQNCNAGLGMFQDNPDLLLAAANYLERN